MAMTATTTVRSVDKIALRSQSSVPVLTLTIWMCAVATVAGGAMVDLRASQADVDACRAAVERARDPEEAKSCFERWRAGMGRAELTRMALQGSPIARLLAIDALLFDRSPRQSLTLDSRPLALEPSGREQLLASILHVLSLPPGTLSVMARYMAHELLWALAGGDMRTAIAYADRLPSLRARFQTSAALKLRDARAYGAVRAPRQAAIAWLVAAVAALAGALMRRGRRPLLAVALSGAAWAGLTQTSHDIWALPPPPLAFVTLWFVPLFAAVLLYAAMIAVAPASPAAVRFVLLPLASAVVAGAIEWKVMQRLGTTGEGLDLIFGPLAATICAGTWALVLAATDAATRRFFTPPAGRRPAPHPTA